jgi:hypothetical protein
MKCTETLMSIACFLERPFFGENDKNPLICSRKRKVQKTAQDINPSGSSHVETIVLLSHNMLNNLIINQNSN